MKKLRKLLLITVFFTVISPIRVFAETNTPPEEKVEEQKVEEQKVEEQKTEEQKAEEGIKVDEDNESPFLYDEEKENPDLTKREKEVIKKPIETPASVTGEKYRGSGTVTDFTTTGGKAFYTIKGTDNTVFYIVIDMDKTEDNVYFLSEINGEELTLEEVSSQQQTKEEVEEPQVKEESKEVEEPKTNNLKFWLIVFIASILFIGYQLFFGKLKNLNPLLNKSKEPEDDKKIEPEKANKEEKEGSIDPYDQKNVNRIQNNNNGLVPDEEDE